jgi:hypothetical protein
MTYLEVLLAGFAASQLACVHIVPRELFDARIAFERTEYGPARTYMPVELSVAEEALDRAQATFQASGATPLVRDQAINALRMTELVEAMATHARRDAEARRISAARSP